jgi:hypothetical protein
LRIGAFAMKKLECWHRYRLGSDRKKLNWKSNWYVS